MNTMSKSNMRIRNGLLIFSGLALIAPSMITSAQATEEKRPALVIENSAIPEDIKENIYTKPQQAREIKPDEVKNEAYYAPTNTLVTGKIDELAGNLKELQDKVALLSANMKALQNDSDTQSADYYAAIATVNTQLQSGTTPGNPRLLERLDKAGMILEGITATVNELNQLGVSTSNIASEATFLLKEAQAAYSVSGAVEEDHVNLTKLEDAINNTIVAIERVLSTVNNDITRTSSYLSSERQNLRTLSLAVTKGDLYGQSLSNKTFSNDEEDTADETAQADELDEPRPLVKIRFDRPDVNYEQPVYMAVNEALARYPQARFTLIAVHPANGNAAEVAIESTRARRNAERVLQTMTQMGLPADRIELSHNQSSEAETNEVHIYIR